MSDNDRNSEITTGAPTRREYVKYGGAVIGAGLLAGCTSSSGSGGGANNSNSSNNSGSGANSSNTPNASTVSNSSNSSGRGNTTTGSSANSYSVTMSPMGEVTFAAVPQNVFTRLTHHAGMVLALGHGDTINAMHAGGYYDVIWNRFLKRLDGVSVQWADLYSSTKFNKEKLYELDSDVHLVDPANVASLENWGESDIQEVKENVSPWFGNTYSGDHAQPPAKYAGDYQYYSLWEIFHKVAKVFREESRYQKLETIHTNLLSTIEGKLPSEGKRPSAVMLLFSSSFEDMWGYALNAPGFYRAHTRPLGATGAFAEANLDVGDNAKIDAEALLEADPDVILILGGMTKNKNMGKTREYLENDSVMQQISAVQNGRVHPQGARVQGPILNLFQLEMTAKQLYPDQFGKWPTYVDGPYPEISSEKQLFDRQRVADIIKGEL